MEISFAKPNAETPVVETTPLVPASTPMPVATYDGGFDDGEISLDDIVIPRLNLVHRVGDLGLIFNPGEIVLNVTTVVYEPENKEKGVPGSGPLVVVPIGFKKITFCEKTVGGAKGRMLRSEAEVVANNGTLDYNEAKSSKGTKQYFERYATALLLIRQPVELLPDEEKQIFTHSIDGANYTLAQFSSKGTAYTAFAKRLMTERKIGFLREGGYPSFSWFFATTMKSYPKEGGGVNLVPVPLLKPGAKTTQAVRDYIKDSLGFGS